MRFGEKITRLLAKNRLTQAELADALGISQPSVARWIKGTKPHQSTAVILAAYFGVNVDDLLDDDKGIEAPLSTKPEVDPLVSERKVIAKKLRAQADAWIKWADELDPEETRSAKEALAELTRRAQAEATRAEVDERKRA